MNDFLPRKNQAQKTLRFYKPKAISRRFIPWSSAIAKLAINLEAAVFSLINAERSELVKHFFNLIQVIIKRHKTYKDVVERRFVIIIFLFQQFGHSTPRKDHDASNRNFSFKQKKIIEKKTRNNL